MDQSSSRTGLDWSEDRTGTEVLSATSRTGPGLHRGQSWSGLGSRSSQIEEKDRTGPDFKSLTTSVNGLIHLTKPLDSQVAQRFLNEFAQAVGINVEFSMHCLRRGGAQYRFMFCAFRERWSLKMCQWWGGWAEGEQVFISVNIVSES